MSVKKRLIHHDMLVDWFQFTIHVYDLDTVLKLLFNTTKDKCVHTMQGLNGYTETYTFGRKMHVMLNQQRADMGINVLFSGSACREYEENFDFKELIQKLGKLDQDYIKINRIDIAIDYFGNDFTVKTIEKKVEKQHLTSRFKKVIIFNEREISTGKRTGEMVSFGRKVSDLHVVFYNKLEERKDAGYKFENEPNNWVRCELRFRHENANALFKKLVDDYDSLGKFVKGTLRHYLSFKVGIYNGDKEHKCRAEECRWWYNFTSNVPKLKLEKKSISSTICKKRDYAENSLSKILALLYLADDKFLPKCVEKGMDKLTEHDWLLLNSYFLHNNMPFMTQKELERIIEKYKENKNVKIAKAEEVVQLKMF